MKIRHFLDCISDKKIWAILRQFMIIKGGHSARHIAKITGLNHRTCSQYLTHLEACSILDMRPVGRAYSYTLKDNFFVREIIAPLLEKERNVYISAKSRIIQKFRKVSKAIVIFGSYARHEETEQSDLDVCFIVHEKTDQLEEDMYLYFEQFSDDYGLAVSPYILSLEEFKEKRSLNVIQDIEREGDWIYGKKREVLI